MISLSYLNFTITELLADIVNGERHTQTVRAFIAKCEDAFQRTSQTIYDDLVYAAVNIDSDTINWSRLQDRFATSQS